VLTIINYSSKTHFKKLYRAIRHEIIIISHFVAKANAFGKIRSAERALVNSSPFVEKCLMCYKTNYLVKVKGGIITFMYINTHTLR